MSKRLGMSGIEATVPVRGKPGIEATVPVRGKPGNEQAMHAEREIIGNKTIVQTISRGG